MKIHHIAYAVKSISDTWQSMQKLGYIKVNDAVYDDIRKINIAFIKEPISDTLIELVEPTLEKNPVSEMINKNNGCASLYHICYECADSLDETIHRLKQDGYMLIQKPESAPALGNKKVAFMFSSKVGVIEIVDK